MVQENHTLPLLQELQHTCPVRFRVLVHVVEDNCVEISGAPGRQAVLCALSEPYNFIGNTRHFLEHGSESGRVKFVPTDHNENAGSHSRCRLGCRTIEIRTASKTACRRQQAEKDRHCEAHDHTATQSEEPRLKAARRQLAYLRILILS